MVSVDWKEGNDSVSRLTSRLEIELAECVETKTVTTTTTTKRSYPPLLIQQHSLTSLDVKEYPLALKETPAELSKFSYGLDRYLMKPYSRLQKREVQDIQAYAKVVTQANIHSNRAPLCDRSVSMILGLVPTMSPEPRPPSWLNHSKQINTGCRRR